VTIFITSKPKPEQCPRCGRLQLIGHDEGLRYRVEPVPLHAHAELAARLAGRRTYAVIAGQLALRDQDRITGDRRRGRPPVIATHSCARPTPPADVDQAHVAAVTRWLAALVRKPVTDADADATDQPDVPAPF
jgi:hypothetical protein